MHSEPPDPPMASPFRQELDHLLESLVRGVLPSLSPLERTALSIQLRKRAWALDRLSVAGPLSGVSDAAMLRLLEMLSERIDQLLVDHGPEIVGERSELEAVGELRAALAR
jgi:hypothetical protein